MWLIPAAFAVGVAAGVLLGRDPAAVLRHRVNMWPLFVLGVADAALIGLGIGVPDSSFLVALSLLLIGAAFALNLHLVGSVIVVAGVTLNLVPLIVNGEIPVRPEAVVAAGIVDAGELDRVDLGAGREFEDDDTILPVLGAVIALEPVREVVTFGDLIVMAGLLNVGFRLAYARREHDDETDAGDEVIDLTNRAVTAARGVAAADGVPRIPGLGPPGRHDETHVYRPIPRRGEPAPPPGEPAEPIRTVEGSARFGVDLEQ